MFERYTESARRIVYFGRYEAAEAGSEEIRTEHLLLAFFHDSNVVLTQFVPRLSQETVRASLKKGATRVARDKDLPLSNESKRVLAYAAEEAERLSSREIAAEHMLLGLMREHKSVAGQLLSEAGAELTALRDAIDPGRHRLPDEMVGRPLRPDETLYCPRCAREVTDPLTCGDCSAVICRACGTPLEIPEELGMG